MFKSLTDNVLTKFVNAMVCLLIGDCMVVIANAPIITSVGYAFETFTPYAMIRFFEFSDKEWNITENCFSDMYEYVEGLRHAEYWAIKCKKLIIAFKRVKSK